MKKNFLILLVLFSIVAPATAMQTTFSNGEPTYYAQSEPVTKIYDKHGSYQGKLVKKSNGQTRVYGKTGSFKGYYKTQNRKIKYYNQK